MDKGDQQSGGNPKNPMTKEAAARIQSNYAKQHGGEVDKGSFPARAQAAAAKNENKSKEGGSELSGEDTKNIMWLRFKMYVVKEKILVISCNYRLLSPAVFLPSNWKRL